MTEVPMLALTALKDRNGGVRIRRCSINVRFLRTITKYSSVDDTNPLADSIKSHLALSSYSTYLESGYRCILDGRSYD
jgi:hypothetical protein